MVLDCASVSGGTSLNEQLLRGAENTSTLIGVILRFRVEDIIVTADITRMFHQVYILPEDRGALSVTCGSQAVTCLKSKDVSDACTHRWSEVLT